MASVSDSLLHNSRTRNLADSTALDELGSGPPCTQLRQGGAFIANGEPQLLPNAAASWRARQRWATRTALCGYYGSLRFRLADGVELALSQFLEYSAGADADFPHYLVETAFLGERAELLNDYAPPSGFSDALAEVPGTSSQPHWFLGGARTGSLLHVDTRCACGWNVCVSGAKRWCFLAPETDLAALGLAAHSEGGPAGWFVDHLPALRRAAADGRVRMREVVQRPGELVFIPAGWHHAVVNLELSCAIAHTLITPGTLPSAWPHLRARHPAFAVALRELLEVARPALARALPADVLTRAPGAEARRNLRLEWRPVPDAAGTRRAILVESTWLLELIASKPSAEAVLDGSRSVEHLHRFHDELDALARAVDGSAQEERALLCVVGGGTDDDETAAFEIAEREAALALHGMRVDGEVSAGGEEAWAAAHGATSMAVLRATAALQEAAADPRWGPIAAAFVWVPSVCHVDPRLTPEKGAGLYAARGCREGDVLLEVPLARCVTSRDAPPEAEAHLPPGDSFGRLALAVMRLYAPRDAGAPPPPLAEYFEAMFGSDALGTMMVSWDADGAAARRAAHSVAWRRAARQRADALAEHAALAAAGVVGADDRERYVWAKLLVQTRAFGLKGGGHAICPVLDLCNHSSLGATCAQRLADDGASMQLVAKYTLDVGDEVTFCYDPDADFLDCFERYGFFDESSVVHTAEVVVGDDALWEGAAGREEWREALVARHAEAGCDAALGAWWVPDAAADACPLFAAVRATLVREDEVVDEEVLARPIAREAEVREKVARLLRAHLAGYACTAEESSAAVLSGRLGAAEEAAARLVAFEGGLLGAQAAALEGRPAEAA